MMMRKLNSVIVLLFLVGAIAWGQSIPQTLQGSWGANGSQAIRINADGSGVWGDGNLSQSATFRVAGNTLRVQAMNMEGLMQWRVDGNTLFLTNPTGFLGELLITVMKNGGVDRLTRMEASVASYVEIYVYSEENNHLTGVAGAEGHILNNLITVSLEGEDGKPFTKSGSYILFLKLSEDDIRVYTNGKTLAEFGITQNNERLHTKLPKYNISSATLTVSLSQFVKAPDWLLDFEG